MKIIINGANGKMGHILTKMAGGENIAALVDVMPAEGMYSSLEEFSGSADCVIDFTNHKATSGVMSYCVSRGLPVLVASTGQTEEELTLIREAAAKIPVFLSPNMSIGVALVADLAERVARVFGECDIELVEAHHNQKLDVPSGTALMLAKRLQEAREAQGITPLNPPLAGGTFTAPDKGRPGGVTLNIGRHENGKRDSNEIGIHSLRYGSEVGTHEVIFSNGLETITIRHDAKDRALFAKGALSAAQWLINQKPGLYGMREFLREV